MTMRSLTSTFLTKFRNAAIGALIGTTFVMTGCGSDAGRITSPLGSSEYNVEVIGGGDGGDGSQGGGSSQPGDIVTGGGSTGVGVTMTISVATGGQIVSGRHTLTLPPGAVRNNVEITLVDLTEELGYPAVRILPEGLQFRRKGVLVTTASDLLDPATSDIFRVHNSNAANGGTWSALGAAMTPDGTGLMVEPPKTGMYAVKTAG